MNVAVILTGHMRCWKQVFPTFEQRVLKKYEPDVFIHTWQDEAYWDPHSEKGIVDGAPNLPVEDINSTYKPIRMVVEDYSHFEAGFAERAKQFPNFYHVPKNIISMFYKMGQGVMLFEDHVMRTGKHYDLVIRMRPDLVFNQDLPDFNPAIFYTLAHKNHVGQGTSDMIQVGNMFTVPLFSKILMHLPALYNKTNLMCPHVLSEQYIRMLGFQWQEFMVNKTIMHTPHGEYVNKNRYMK